MKNVTMAQQRRAENSANSVYEAKESNCEPFCRARLNQAGSPRKYEPDATFSTR